MTLTYVRGADEAAVLAAFGADPRPVLSTGEPADDADAVRLNVPTIQVARMADWLLVLEDNIPSEGNRLEVLARLSADGARVSAVHEDIAKNNHEFGYAVDGEVIATLVTAWPLGWGGSDMEQVLPLGRELGLAPDSGIEDAEPDQLTALYTMAQRVIGVTEDQENLARQRRGEPIPVLPVLSDLGPRPPADRVFLSGDGEIDRRLAGPDEAALAEVLRVRTARHLAECGLDGHPELVEAFRVAATGGVFRITDEDPVGVLLRRLALEGDYYHYYPPTESARQAHRERRAGVAWDLRHVLDGRVRQALALSIHRDKHTADWRARVLADLAAVPAGPA